MPDQSTPEISRLRIAAYDDYPSPGPFVRLDLAIQAVRDTEARVRADCAATYLLDGVAEARREAFREAVEALRELAETESGEAATALRGAALLLAARLSPDNPEGNA